MGAPSKMEPVCRFSSNGGFPVLGVTVVDGQGAYGNRNAALVYPPRALFSATSLGCEGSRASA